MITAEFINELHCPYCGSTLEIERSAGQASAMSHGVVRCHCYRYPVIDGILILRQESSPSSTVDRRVEWLDAGNVQQARAQALGMISGGRLARARRRIAGLAARAGLRTAGAPQDEALSLREFLESTRSHLYAQYLYQRYCNISFLASIAPLLLLKLVENRHPPTKPARPLRMLELACGIGHSAFLINSLFPRISLVASDHDFANLYVAQRYLSPNATYVCTDAEAPLPFRDAQFDAIFCLDGFHYIRSKLALLRELDRVADAAALWLFPHLHNANCVNFAAGIPLSPEDYQRCFAPIPLRLFDEAKVLRQFVTDGSLDLSGEPSHDVDNSPNLIGIATRESIWSRHDDLLETWSQASTPLTINPIYQAKGLGGDKLRLQLVWPSKRLEQECGGVSAFMPSTVDLDRKLLDVLRAPGGKGMDTPEVRELIRSFVLVRLPERYVDAPVS